MRIESLHDFDCRHPEDDNASFVSEDGVFAFVADGCSEPHFGSPFMYPGGLTGGQVVTRAIRNVFSNARSDESLQDLVLRANERVWIDQKEHRGDKVSRDDATTLANASFSCLKFDRVSGKTEVIWGADVFTIWKTKSGRMGISGGDNREADMERERIYADMVASAKGDLEEEKAAKMQYWLKEFPRLKRQQDNVLYACLNGSPEVSKHWHREFISDPLELIVLLSDGAWIPMEEWSDNPSRADHFVQLLKSGGWTCALPWVREQQSRGLTNQRVKRPEAAGLSIFTD